MMSEGFDFFGALGEVAHGVGDVAQTAANAVGAGAVVAAGVVGAGAGAVVEAAGTAVNAVGEAISDAVNPKPREEKGTRLVPKYCETVQRASFPLVPKFITVRCVTPGSDGRPVEGRRQALKLSKRGVYLLSSDDLWSAEVERVSISNCCVFKNGTDPGANPLLTALGIVQSLLMSPAMSPIMGLIGFICCTREQDRWYLLVLGHDGSERLFRVGSQEDGDELLEFLDSHMLPQPE